MAISIPDLEQRAALGWRAPEEERLGDWLLRAADGFTGRVNSALAIGHPGYPLDQAAQVVQDWYQARGLPAMIAVPYPADRPQAAPVSRFLAERGWSVRSGAVTVMTAPARQIARTAGRAPDAPAGTRVGVDPQPDEAWLHPASPAGPSPAGTVLAARATCPVRAVITVAVRARTPQPSRARKPSSGTAWGRPAG